MLGRMMGEEEEKKKKDSPAKLNEQQRWPQRPQRNHGRAEKRSPASCWRSDVCWVAKPTARRSILAAGMGKPWVLGLRSRSKV